jgi:hypothetical protein
LIVGPRSWLEDDFWERYHDGDPDAEKNFNNEFAVMK